MKHKVFLVLCVILCQANTVFAESLADVYKLAMSRSEVIRIQQEKITEAKAVRREAVGTVLPQVNLLGSESFQDGSGGLSTSGSSSAFTATNRPEYKVSVKQSLYSGFRDRHTLHALDAQIRKETVLLEQSKRALFSQVTDVYFQVLLFEKDEKILHQAAQSLQSRIDELQKRAAIGKSKSSEVLTTQSQFYQLKAQETQARGQALQARSNLSNLINQDTDSLKLTDLSAAEDASIRPNVSKVLNRTEIAALKADVDYFTYAKKAAEGAHLPELSVGGNYYLRRIDFLSPIKWDAALTLSIPLYSGGTTSAKVDEANSQLSQIQNELDRKTRDVLIDIQNAYLALQSSKSQEETLKIAHQKSEQSYQTVSSEYRLGLSNNLDVLQSLNSLLDIRRALNKTHNQHCVDYIKFKLSTQELSNITKIRFIFPRISLQNSFLI